MLSTSILFVSKGMTPMCEHLLCIELQSKDFHTYFGTEKHLIGFNNGYSNLKTSSFYKCMPDIFFTMSCGYNFPIEKPCYYDKVKQFLKQVIPKNVYT